MRGVNTELLALRERGVCATRLNGDWEMKCQCQSQTEINICVCNLSINTCVLVQLLLQTQHTSSVIGRQYARVWSSRLQYKRFTDHLSFFKQSRDRSKVMA